MQPKDPSDTSFIMKPHDDKLPHDASVFVGSLPSNIDQGELTRLLLDHLSEHIQIKTIKVVRDSKGGVCAFVQCENAASATSLIQTLHSSTPKPFLGRILRYEPARAFRTLLISYRAPVQFARSTLHSPSNAINEVDLELPTAMRIWKHGNSRFHSILYNLEAVQNEENRVGISADSNVIFFHPLNFDEETLHKLASYFGGLETFSPLQVGNPGEVTRCEDKAMGAANTEYGTFPAPHCARRSPAMNKQCWEVKWEHRDDCVSALMTLRRVPHLTVTWAHQPSSIGHHIPGSPSYSPHMQRQIFTSPISPSALRTRARRDAGDVDGVFATNAEAAHPHLARPSYPTNYVPAARESTNDSWAEEECNISTKNDVDSAFDNGGMTPVTFSRSSCARMKASSLQTLPGSEEPREPCKFETHPEAVSVRAADVDNQAEVEGQELYMPQTPALDGSSITPLTPGSQFPITPTDCEADILQDAFYNGFQPRENGNLCKVSRPEREIDPTTLFVGGLEMFGPGAWDEEKVKNFFSRFGGLESVKVVRPVNSCAAFAFVKFDNPESPSRAVFEEHNRVYEGRAMRVQLRDCNPSRNNWKYGRGRGRLHHNHLGTQRNLHFRPPYRQGHMPVQAENDIKVDFNDTANVSEIQLSPLANDLSSSRPLRDDNLSGIAQPSASLLGVAPSSKDNTPGEKYREWYDAPESPTHTPEPTSLGSSVSTAGLSFSAPPYSYPIPTGPYFPPPWAHPYIPQMPYQVPYYPGYAVYPPTTPQLHQPITSPPSSEASGPESGPQHPWPHMGMYASYIPYPTVPLRPSLMEQGQPQHIATQAPLIPTGFIQNEQGTLIAVYQPEALDQYLAGSGNVPATAARQPHPCLPRWGNATPYPYDMGGAHPINNAYSTPSQIRFKSPGIPPAASQQFSDYQQSPRPLRGMGPSPSDTPPPLYRRQGSRRETQQNYNSVRHVHPHTFNGQPARGGNNPHIQTADLEHSVSQLSMRNGEWNRLNGAR